LPVHVDGCRRAGDAAARILQAGGYALDAVQKAVETLETIEDFNAGTGAALTADGTLEYDAALMEGRELRAGGVCALEPFEHPIAVARAVLEEDRHVLYAGAGATRFARGHGFSPADPAQMMSERAQQRLRKVQAVQATDNWAGDTVGAVARDRAGNVAAATSTGGIMGKPPGRVGDCPMIGAGTYADNLSGAAAATGLGEAIARVHLCGRVTLMMRDGAAPLEAARAGIEELTRRTQGAGGIILVDGTGRLAWARNTPTMTWSAGWEGADLQAGG
jgi:beta-aspartyl-peptidase (threonine type)